MKNKEQIYFIAGCPRSGTSLIAGLLAKHGVCVGNTTPGDKHNEKGYFENKEIGRIIKEIMRQNEMKKRSDIKNIPKKLKIDFDKTWSCYDKSDTPCGKCNKCLLREKYLS